MNLNCEEEGLTVYPEAIIENPSLTKLTITQLFAHTLPYLSEVENECASKPGMQYVDTCCLAFGSLQSCSSPNNRCK